MAKKSNLLRRSAMKDVLYGGIISLMDNTEYYYRSSVGPAYNHWTESGLEALQSYLDMMSPKIAEVEANELDRRAKDLVLKELKES